MKQRNNSNITSMFSGFKMVRKKIDGRIVAVPKAPQFSLTRSLFRFLEKCETLTELQHSIVQEQLNKCTENINPEYVARLVTLTEKFVPTQGEKKK